MPLLNKKILYPFCVLLFVLFPASHLSPLTSKQPQDLKIQHEAMAINIEVPVRVFEGDLYVTKPLIDSVDIQRQGSQRGLRHRDITEDIYKAFSGIASDTGGIIESSANVSAAFQKAASASENYYLLYYSPQDYKPDGKFRKIRVRVKGKNYKVNHRAGYIAD